MTTRLAMWSGPRNISTAMMRSWENREDCSVIDEPFYAYYLANTGSPHPMFSEILASQSSDYERISAAMSQGSCSTKLQYQKQMTHHMLADCDLGWTQGLQHCFLIRDPVQVVHSYTNSRGECSALDIGIQRQYELFEEITKLSGQHIPIIDSSVVLHNPERILRGLCEALRLDFDSNMLAWPAGPRTSDGIWASHWYHSVEASTGFAQPKDVSFTLSRSQLEVVEEVMPYYQKMKALALT